MKTYQSYAKLQKPSWAPPSRVFGPVWSFLYLGIAISFGVVVYKFFQQELPFLVVLPFLLNLIFNFLFTPIQFGLKNNYLAAADIVLVLGTLLWAIGVVYPFVPWVAYAQLPYLAWVTFATALQLTITYLNWGK